MRDLIHEGANWAFDKFAFTLAGGMKRSAHWLAEHCPATEPYLAHAGFNVGAALPDASSPGSSGP